jgi:hypothetical protein
MRLSRNYCLAIATALLLTVSAYAQEPDNSLAIYAVNVVKTRPFRKQFTGYGIYLGNGLVITAAHVIGHWPFFTRPRVLIADQDLPATILKEGSFEETDLALLSIDDTRLPMRLRLRRNPLCKQPPEVGAAVLDVATTGTDRVQIISPLTVAAQFRRKFDSFISSPEGSGSGLFDDDHKCLVGIISGEVPKYKYLTMKGRVITTANGFAGFFVSAAKIADFIPAKIHF